MQFKGEKKSTKCDRIENLLKVCKRMSKAGIFSKNNA